MVAIFFSKVASKCLPIILLSICFSCAGKTKEPVYNVSRAHSRIVGIVADNESGPMVPELERAIKELYGCKIFILSSPIKKRSSVQNPLPVDAGYEASKLNADDLFTIESSDLDPLNEKKFEVSIYSLSDFRKIAGFNVSNDKLLPDRLRGSLAGAYSNPNSIPKGDRKTIAYHLEKRGELERALELLKMEREANSTYFIHDITALDDLDNRINSLEKKVTLRKCIKEDALAEYSVTFENNGLSEDYFELLKKSFDELGIKSILSRYTGKPVLVKLQYSSLENKGNLWLEMRYWPQWFQAKTASFPKQINSKRVISFQPYYDLMATLRKLIARFASKVGSSAKDDVLAFTSSLVLTKPCDQYIVLTAATGSGGGILPPYYLTVRVSDFGETTLQTADETIFYQSGMFALGPAKLLSGERTTYGLVYDFLEIGD